MKLNYDIVIPCFKGDKRLDGCIRSIRRAREDAHLIVVFNSVREIPEFVRRFRRVDCLLSKERLSPARARNLGFSRSDAEWVVFLDCDCTVGADYFKVLNSLLQRIADDDEIVAITSKIRNVENSRWAALEAEMENAKDYNFTSGDLTFTKILRGPNMIFKSVFFRAIGAFDDTLPNAEDRDLGAKINLARKKIIFGDHLLVTHQYTKRLTSIIKRHRWHAQGNAMTYARYPQFFKDSVLKRLRFIFYFNFSKKFRDAVFEFIYHFLIGTTYAMAFYPLLIKEKNKARSLSGK